MSTHPQLAAMKSRADQASDGPWFDNETTESIANCVWNSNGDSATLPHDQEKQICGQGFFEHLRPSPEQHDKNMRFIAHARTDLPKLVDTLLAVIAELESTHFVGREGEFAEGVMAIINRELSPPTDAQVSQELAAAGINMKPAFKRLHEMIDAHKWKRSVEIGWKSENEYWARWTSEDGLYYWLHPDRNEWIGEPHQQAMPMYPTRLAAEQAVLSAPLPPGINRELAK